MPIRIGETITSARLRVASPGEPREVHTDDIFRDKTVVLFGVPGAFTPACSKHHMPGYVRMVDQIRAEGVDTIACVAINDVFVMRAWGQDQSVGDKIVMLADTGAFTKGLGLEHDLLGSGYGVRSLRYALIARNARVTHLAVESEITAVEVSSAAAVLQALKG